MAVNLDPQVLTGKKIGRGRGEKDKDRPRVRTLYPKPCFKSKIKEKTTILHQLCEYSKSASIFRWIQNLSKLKQN